MIISAGETSLQVEGPMQNVNRCTPSYRVTHPWAISCINVELAPLHFAVNLLRSLQAKYMLTKVRR